MRMLALLCPAPSTCPLNMGLKQMPFAPDHENVSRVLNLRVFLWILPLFWTEVEGDMGPCICPVWTMMESHASLECFEFSAQG